MSEISIKNLRVAYAGQEAIKGVSIDIPDKQITAIIGPSGCGKTTLLKSINRLINLQEGIKVSGQVIINGGNIYSSDADILAVRKKVGFLPQKPSPLPMSIYDNVAFAPRIHGFTDEEIIEQLKKAKSRGLVDGESQNESDIDLKSQKPMNALVEHYLKLVGLWDEVKHRLHAPAAKLSVGQQQRLALARALSIEPEVILADEPTSALDPISSKQIEKIFNSLKKDYTIILVTHILRQAKRIADYVAFMYLGELIEHGPAESFFNNPQRKETKAYLSGEIS